MELKTYSACHLRECPFLQPEPAAPAPVKFLANRFLPVPAAAFVALVCGTCPLPLHARTIVLDGLPTAEIVVADNPARMTKLAVRELQDYIEKISGASLPVVAEPGDAPVRIFVGKSRFTDELGLATDNLAHGAFRMASGPDWLALLGPDKDFEPIEPWARKRRDDLKYQEQWDAISGGTYRSPYWNLFRMVAPSLDIWLYDDTGTLNAVHEFLRELGVRWYFPGELGEVVPKKNRIDLPTTNRVVRPDFPLRYLNWYYQAGMEDDFQLWNLRMGVNPGHDIIGLTQCVHGMKFVTTREEMKRTHPDYYALWNGKRATEHRECGAPCLSSEGLFREHLRYARALFDHYQEPMISVDVCDGYGRSICEDEQCRIQATPERGLRGTLSEYVWGYVDRVARELYESHPERRVSGIAYSSYMLPPEKIAGFSPNLSVFINQRRSAFGNAETRTENRMLRQAWLEKLGPGKLMIFEHYTPETGIPAYFTRLIAEDLRALKGVSIGDAVEVYQHLNPADHVWHSMAVMHLNLYVTSRFWWDAEQSLDRLLEEYFTLFYGPAAGAMQTFVDFCEEHWPAIRQNPELAREAIGLAAQARAAAGDAGVYARRIELVQDFLKPLENLIASLERTRNKDLSYRVLEARNIHAKGVTAGNNPIDGILDPEFWPAVRRAPLRANKPGEPEPPRGWFQMFRHGNTLYAAIHCSEPDMAGLAIGTENDGDPAIFDGDYATLLLETNTHSYYEIAVNPAGAVYEMDRAPDGSAEWRSKSRIAVHRGKDFWNVEMSIPVAGEGTREEDPLLGIDGTVPQQIYPWHFNVGRQRVRGGQISRAAVSPTGTSGFHVPEAFAEMWGKGSRAATARKNLSE